MQNNFSYTGLKTIKRDAVAVVKFYAVDNAELNANWHQRSVLYRVAVASSVVVVYEAADSSAECSAGDSDLYDSSSDDKHYYLTVKAFHGNVFVCSVSEWRTWCSNNSAFGRCEVEDSGTTLTDLEDVRIHVGVAVFVETIASSGLCEDV